MKRFFPLIGAVVFLILTALLSWATWQAVAPSAAAAPDEVSSFTFRAVILTFAGAFLMAAAFIGLLALLRRR